MDEQRAAREIDAARDRFEKAMMGGDENFVRLMVTMGDVMVDALLAVLKDADSAEMFLEGMHAKIQRWRLEKGSSLTVQ